MLKQTKRWRLGEEMEMETKMERLTAGMFVSGSCAAGSRLSTEDALVRGQHRHRHRQIDPCRPAKCTDAGRSPTELKGLLRR